MIRSFYIKYLHDIEIAIEAILTNKTKSMLTALGIIFGVAAVISMLAIGNGAQAEIIQQMKQVGVNNIIVMPKVKEQKSDSEEEIKVGNEKFSPGLSLEDAEKISKTIPTVKLTCPEIYYNTKLIREGVIKKTKLVGTSSHYFDLYNVKLTQGEKFTDYHQLNGSKVCIINQNIKTVFFKGDNPIGKTIKCGKEWLKVIGVTAKRSISKDSKKLGIKLAQYNVYIPTKTMLLRYKNNSYINKLEPNNFFRRNQTKKKAKISHQLDKLTIQVTDANYIKPTVDVVKRQVYRLHNNIEDFVVQVPELLLKQQQETKDIFNIVLGVIAGISLLVGGIGIMNIMLASVMERIKEIGTRMALGASQKDIIVQFLAEAVLISVIGGLIGVILGYTFSIIIERVADIKTIVSFGSVAIAFGVSATIGVLFGYMPANKAAKQDPIESLRN